MIQAGDQDHRKPAYDAALMGLCVAYIANGIGEHGKALSLGRQCLHGLKGAAGDHGTGLLCQVAGIQMKGVFYVRDLELGCGLVGFFDAVLNPSVN